MIVNDLNLDSWVSIQPDACIALTEWKLQFPYTSWGLTGYWTKSQHNSCTPQGWCQLMIMHYSHCQRANQTVSLDLRFSLLFANDCSLPIMCNKSLADNPCVVPRLWVAAEINYNDNNYNVDKYNDDVYICTYYRSHENVPNDNLPISPRERENKLYHNYFDSVFYKLVRCLIKWVALTYRYIHFIL